MYRIIGGDGRQYGPIPQDQLRQWMTDGRVNSQTLVQPEGATDWKPVAAIPELAALFAASAAPPPVYVEDTRKSKLIAGLLGIFIGSLGIHRFYLGYIGIGVAQIVVTFATCGIGAIWGLIEGILILCGSAITTDAEGRTLKEQ